jgi:hypothetical protein
VSRLSQSQRVAAGVHPPPSTSTSSPRADPFAATRAAWRFYSNPAVTLPRLAAPLVECARAGVAAACDAYALVALDFCPRLD